MNETIKKIIAPICFTITVILLVVIGIVCTETMLKDYDKLAEEKPIMDALQEVVGEYDSYQVKDTSDLAKLDDEHKLIKSYTVKKDGKVYAYAYIAEMKSHSANKTPMTILYTITLDKKILKPVVLDSDPNDYFNAASNASNFNFVLDSINDRTVNNPNYGNNLQVVAGATFSSNAIINGAKLARLQFYKDINETAPFVPQEPTEQEKMDALLKNVNVTNGKKMEYTVADGSTIKNIYTGKNETEEVYVFETEKSVDVQYPNGGGETVVVKMLTSISQENGTIEKIYFSTFASHGIAPTEFGVVGKDSVNDFVNITQATYSSNGVKAMLQEILTEYGKIKQAAEEAELQAMNDLLAKVEVTEGSKVVYTPAENSEITAVYQGKCNEKDVYVFDGKSTNDFVTVHMLVVVDKATGEVLTSKVIGMFHTYNVQPTDFGMVGATNIDSFENITGATFSSNSAKAIFSAAFAAYTTLKGAE